MTHAGDHLGLLARGEILGGLLDHGEKFGGVGREIQAGEGDEYDGGAYPGIGRGQGQCVTAGHAGAEDAQPVGVDVVAVGEVIERVAVGALLCVEVHVLARCALTGGHEHVVAVCVGDQDAAEVRFVDRAGVCLCPPGEGRGHCWRRRRV
ncbi:hypothetical protein [Streptomyces sp. NPDC101455]|uniref:hypothetical protein n=1 Tax=Streptomyces sp. NPDC101455 TaxID=3366142 RepID=UPI00380976B2